MQTPVIADGGTLASVSAGTMGPLNVTDGTLGPVSVAGGALESLSVASRRHGAGELFIISEVPL